MQHLLLLHGAIGSAGQFSALDKLLSHGFHIHRINFRGHGGGELPESYSIALFANDVLDYIAEHKLERPNIFGYSMGGYVALYLARHYPDIGDIFTFATKFSWTPEIAQKETKMLDAAKIEEKIPAFANVLRERHQPADWKSVLSKTAGMMISMGSKNPLSADDFALIQNKVRLGIGDEDAMVTLEETIDVYRKLPNASLLVLPDTPHPIEKMSVEKLRQEIVSFFG